jgi:hypothetical protein
VKESERVVDFLSSLQESVRAAGKADPEAAVEQVARLAVVVETERPEDASTSGCCSDRMGRYNTEQPPW